MCLDSASMIVRDATKIGYKVMLNHVFEYEFPIRGGRVASKVWLMAKSPDAVIYMTNKRKDDEYDSGFHIFRTLEGAEKYLAKEYTSSLAVVVKVEYRAVVAEGKQYGSRVDVAQMMKIVGKV